MTRSPVTALKPVYHDGRAYNVGAKFDMLDSHIESHVKAGLVIQREGKAGEAPQQVEIEKFTSEAEELAALKAQWDTESAEMTPAQYLEKFPQGPVADLAFRIVELEAEAAESAT